MHPCLIDGDDSPSKTSLGHHNGELQGVIVETEQLLSKDRDGVGRLRMVTVQLPDISADEGSVQKPVISPPNHTSATVRQ